MDEHSRRTVETLLASHSPGDLHRGLELVKKEISRVGSDEAGTLFEMVSTLFYIDPLDRPDLAPLLNEAIALVVGFGKWVIPPLLRQLDGSDLKAYMVIANALGRLGADAIAPLLAEYQSASDSERRQFVLYALGKIKSPKVAQAAALAIEAAEGQDRELRDTATRAIGKFVESIPPSALPEETRRRFVQVLRKNLGDRSPAIRAKAVRSLGKLAKYEHLTPDERHTVQRTIEHLLGMDERFEWDRAYLVRKEAAEALTYL
jgi:hypothetical protein